MSQRRTIHRRLNQGDGLDPDGLLLPRKASCCFCESRWRQCLACYFATLTMFVVGTINGWTTICFHYLIAVTGSVPLMLTHDEYSWIVSFTIVGSIIGALMAAQLVDRSGRKQCLLVCSITFTVGWFIIYEATSVPMLYFARLILGIGVGIAHTINPMYVSEVANRNLRGALGTLTAINALKGSLLTCTLGLFLTYKSLLTVLVIISFISLFSNTCFPETPYFLLAKGRKQQARKSISYYKGITDPHRVEFELHPQCAQTRHELLQQSTSDLPSQSRSDLPSQSRSNLRSQSTCEAHSDPIREVDIEATSDLHLSSSSDSHAQSISSVYSKFICEVHTQPTGESRVEYSRDWSRLPSQTPPKSHSQSTSDLHRPTTSQVHRPSTSEIHLEATSEIHPETTSEIHPETTSEMHPETTSEIHPETTNEIHPETTNEINRPSTSEILRPSTSEILRPSTSEILLPFTGEVHRLSTGEVHRPSTSEVHRPSTSEVHRPSTSEVHRPSTSEVHRPSTSEVHRPSTSEVHRPSTSEVHRPSTSEVHRPSASEVHRPSTSEIRLDDSYEMLPDRTCEILSRSNEYLRQWADIDEIRVDFTKYNWSTKLRAIILQRSNRKALFIMLGLTMAQHLSGNYITTQYLKVLLSKTAIALNPYKTTLTIHIISIISGGFTIATVEYLGRRTLLIMSTLGTCCPLIILANYLLLVEHKFDISITSIPIFNLVTQQILFQIGLGTLPNILRCELFPAELRGFVGAIIVIFDGIIGFTVSKLYQVITNNIGSYANYMIFGASCLMAFMMVIIWIPETKGKTYREIEALLFGENFHSLNEEDSNDEMDTRRI